MKRTHMEPLPRQDPLRGTLRFVQRALTQTNVQRVEITARGIEVEREMEDDSPVVPDGSNDVDMNFLLARIELLTHPFDPKEHPVYALYGAAHRLEELNLTLHAVVAPSWPLFSAWLGIETTPTPPKTVFGMPLVVAGPNTTNGRVVLLGAPPQSLFRTDVSLGIAVDLGV